MAKRKTMSQRLRFEILKRDGFRCRYCGVTPQARVLRVDHVVPVSKGGTNDPLNLVTACDPCNSGKTNRSLDESHIAALANPADLKEQAKQIRHYLQAMQDLDVARDQLFATVHARWEQRIGTMSKDMGRRLRSLLTSYPVDVLMKAIEAVGRSHLASPGAEYSWPHALDQQQYFSGVLRSFRAEAKA